MERLLASQLSQGPLVPLIPPVPGIPLVAMSQSSESAKPEAAIARQLPTSGLTPAQGIAYVPIEQQTPMAQPKPRGVAGGRHGRMVLPVRSAAPVGKA